MKKVLLVDTNVSSAPIYKYLDGAGYKVYVVGADDKDFLAKCAPNYINLDYSNPALLVELIDALEIDYLIPGCNDVSYRSCSLANKDNQFPGIDSIVNVDILNNKKKLLIMIIFEDIYSFMDREEFENEMDDDQEVYDQEEYDQEVNEIAQALLDFDEA